MSDWCGHQVLLRALMGQCLLYESGAILLLINHTLLLLLLPGNLLWLHFSELAHEFSLVLQVITILSIKERPIIWLGLVNSLCPCTITPSMSLHDITIKWIVSQVKLRSIVIYFSWVRSRRALVIIHHLSEEAVEVGSFSLIWSHRSVDNSCVNLWNSWSVSGEILHLSARLPGLAILFILLGQKCAKVNHGMWHLLSLLVLHSTFSWAMALWPVILCRHWARLRYNGGVKSRLRLYRLEYWTLIVFQFHLPRRWLLFCHLWRAFQPLRIYVGGVCHICFNILILYLNLFMEYRI